MSSKCFKGEYEEDAEILMDFTYFFFLLNQYSTTHTNSLSNIICEKQEMGVKLKTLGQS